VYGGRNRGGDDPGFRDLITEAMQTLRNRMPGTTGCVGDKPVGYPAPVEFQERPVRSSDLPVTCVENAIDIDQDCSNIHLSPLDCH
jgi:hypothetical protein